MRAVKTILAAAGNLRQRLDWGEEQITLRAIMDANVPKFTSGDIPLFTGIVGDLFPTIKLPPSNDEALRTSIRMAGERSGLSPVPVFIDKCMQLYETVGVRHGLMLVGSTLSGKSCVLRTLARALTGIAKKEYGVHMNEDDPSLSVKPRPVQTKAINPKALTLNQLYGTFDENTHEWTDGVLAFAIRKFTTDDTIATDLKWLVFDGPVDAVWIESMNTVRRLESSHTKQKGGGGVCIVTTSHTRSCRRGAGAGR